MYDGQVILATGTGGTTTVYTPWFPRGGDHGAFTLEVSAWSESNSGTKLKIEVYHKVRDEAGDGGLAGTGTDNIELTSNNGAARSTRDWDTVTFKDLVRFKITFTASSGTQWGIFRILPPVWYDAVKA